MEWVYKNIIITVESDGKFHFTIEGKPVKRSSLEDAKNTIDIKLEYYYTFNAGAIDNLCKKLDKRESEFVIALIEELNRHKSNAYCELSISDDMLFKF